MTKTFTRLLTLLALMMLFCQTAAAEKIEFKDDSYNFHNIKNIAVYDLDFSKADTGSSILEKSLNAMYFKKAAQEKLSVMNFESISRKMSLALGQDMDILAEKDWDAFNKLYDEHLPDYVDAYVTADVLQYETQSIYHPEYTTWETKTQKSYVKDSKGNRIEVEDEVLVPVTHPAYYSSVIYEKVEFHVYDARTGREVYSRQEWRDRDDDDGIDMFGRICSAFFKDLRKLTK
ncbi:hypothetical protein [Anaerovibrio sp.]|uniref:hypothetical protein n=1 Tax=Anaerovibrio sp. TaxID=1872532 RepID=UPI003F168756